MAPTGDAYGIDSFQGAEASANTMISEDSEGSFTCSLVSDGTDGGKRTRHRSTWSSDASEEACVGLGEVQNPKKEAHRRITDHHEYIGETSANTSSTGEF